MKNKLKILPIISLALISGALVLGYTPKMETVHAASETNYNVGYGTTSSDATMEEHCQYFNLKNTSSPFNSDWSVRYYPKTTDAVILIRDGVSYNVGNPAAGTLVKISRTKYELETWMFSPVLGLESFSFKHGDCIILEGAFSYTDGDSNIHTINISKTTFLCSNGRVVNGTMERTYFAALPKDITDTSQYTFAMSVNSWHMLFYINGLEESLAPRTGDTASDSYYPTSSDCFYVNGESFARVDKEGLRRRDAGSYEWYPCINSDIQNIEQYLQVGSIFVIDGVFTCYKSVSGYTMNDRLGISFKMLTFERIGTSPNDYRIIDLHEYLSNSIYSQYSASDFIDSDQDVAVATLDAFDEQLALAETARASYKIYNDTLAVLATLSVDPTALERMKAQAIEEINQYANLDGYFNDEKVIVSGYINQYTTLINGAFNRGEINSYIDEFKSLVDAVASKTDIMTDAIINQTAGYENYLMKKDQVSLFDLGFETPLTFHGKLSEREKDINTNVQENNIHNTFAPSSDNELGNVEFVVNYTPNAVPNEGANFASVLRGIAYYGYKFVIDTPTRGCYVERLDQSSSKFLGGTGDNVFENGNTYEIAIGAIDLVDEVDLTWVYIKINGVFKFNKVIDSLAICTNARVAIGPNDNKNATNDYEGSVIVEDASLSLLQSSGIYTGRMVYASGNNKEIRVSMDPNSLPSNKDGLEVSYSTRANNIQLTRNDVTTNIAKVSTPLIKKLNDTEYVVDVGKCVELQNDDTIYIIGTFYSYSDSSHTKTAFTVAASRFKYIASSDSWQPIVSLQEAREDAIKKLENYVDLSKYDSEDQRNIESIIQAGTAAINAATSIEEVDSILATYKAQIEAVKTSFRKYQDNAIQVINAYKDDELNKYRQDEVQDIASLKAAAVIAVNEAITVEEVDEIVLNLKLDIDALKTDEQYAAEELADSIKTGQQRIYDYYSSIDTSTYSQSELAQLEQDTKNAINAVKNAKSIEEVEYIVSTYINNHPQSRKGKTGGCKASIGSSSSTVFIAAIGGLIFAIRQAYKYRKKEN